MKNKKYLVFLTKVAIFAALSFVLYMFPKFPLPFFPSFLEIQFSNLPAILGGLMLGPIGGTLIVIIRFITKLPFTSTAYVGEIADLILGLFVVVPASLCYKNHKTKKGGIISLLISTLCWVVSSIFINIFINIPLYVNLYCGGDLNTLIKICNLFVKNVDESNFMFYYCLTAVIPFNTILSVLVNLIAFISYKRLSTIFKSDFIFRYKKVLVISDSFKGTLSSKQVGEIISDELKKKNINASYLAVSDGGEGFLDAILSNDQELQVINVESVDAIRRPKQTYYLYDSKTKTAYFELANVVGITDLKQEELSPYNANTFGLGLLIKIAIKTSDIKNVILGIGGSASTDGGSGLLEALGVKFYDKANNLIVNLDNYKLALIHHFDLTDFIELVKGISFKTLTDVSNPLIGHNGSAYIYGIQKGAKESDLNNMDNNLANFNLVTTKYFGIDYKDEKGSGAAGGVGYAMRAFFNSSLSSGIDYILDMINLKDIIHQYDSVITGEGMLDEQSINGKVISGVIRAVPKHLDLVVGVNRLDDSFFSKNNLANLPFSKNLAKIDITIYSVVSMITTKENSMKNPEEYLRMLISKYYKL